MRLYEYEAKRLFKADGIPIPMQYGVIKGAEDLVKLKIDFPVMLKAQVLVGGRGKQGGIVKAIDIEEVRTAADKLFAIKIDKYPIKSLLIDLKAIKSVLGASITQLLELKVEETK